MTNTISVSQAASDLGLSESDFRKLLKGIYKQHEIVKKISFDNFQLIAKTLQTQAQSDLEPLVDITSDEPVTNSDETITSDETIFEESTSTLRRKFR